MIYYKSKKRYLKEKLGEKQQYFTLIQNQEPSVNHSFFLLISIQKGIMLTFE